MQLRWANNSAQDAPQGKVGKTGDQDSMDESRATISRARCLQHAMKDFGRDIGTRESGDRLPGVESPKK